MSRGNCSSGSKGRKIGLKGNGGTKSNKTSIETCHGNKCIKELNIAIYGFASQRDFMYQFPGVHHLFQSFQNTGWMPEKNFSYSGQAAFVIIQNGLKDTFRNSVCGYCKGRLNICIVNAGYFAAFQSVQSFLFRHFADGDQIIGVIFYLIQEPKKQGIGSFGFHDSYRYCFKVCLADIPKSKKEESTKYQRKHQRPENHRKISQFDPETIGNKMYH